MNTEAEYNEMAHVADIVSYKKLDPKEAVKAQFAMWVAEKIAALEARVAALEPSTETSGEESTEEETTEPQA